MKRAVETLSTLAEPGRLAALWLVWRGDEVCICRLARVLGRSRSAALHDVEALAAAGLVIERRDGCWVRYRRNPALPDPDAAVADAALGLIAGPRGARA